MPSTLNYGNWIRKRVLAILGLMALFSAVLSFLPLPRFAHWLAIFFFIVMLLTLLVPLYSFIMFSQRGGRYQEKLYGLIIDHLGPDVSGAALDIGAGNGVLAILLAQRHPGAQVTAMDYWGADWEYSQGVCQQNARLAGVADRVRFQRGDAAALDFPDGAFDAAVSNLTFHEVRSQPDKRLVLQEALRILKPAAASPSSITSTTPGSTAHPPASTPSYKASTSPMWSATSSRTCSRCPCCSATRAAWAASPSSPARNNLPYFSTVVDFLCKLTYRATSALSPFHMI